MNKRERPFGFNRRGRRGAENSSPQRTQTGPAAGTAALLPNADYWFASLKSTGTEVFSHSSFMTPALGPRCSNEMVN